MGLTITDLSHQRIHTHSLSLSLSVVGCQKKKWREDKVENDTKQKNRWRQKKWMQDSSIENEYKKWK